MLKVILVEDEPSALRYLKSIIENKCIGFEVVDTAEDGIEGLEKIRKIRPDVVITDIKMGRMDGIELVSNVKEEFPSIYSIIVSGYQEFEYAKSAMKCGVIDYLLKPVSIKQMQKSLDTIREKLEVDYYKKQIDLFEQCLAGSTVQKWEVEKYLPYKHYSAAIVRKNGLLSRFSSTYNLLNYTEEKELSILQSEMRCKHIWVIPGRDEQEFLLFHSTETLSENNFMNYVETICKDMECNYYTLVFTSKLFTYTDAKKVVSKLYRLLDYSIVIGLSQKIYLNNDIKSNIGAPPILNGNLKNKMDYLLCNHMYDELKEELIKIFSVWEAELRPQWWIESYIKQILRHVEKYSSKSHRNEGYDMEYMLDEVFYYSASLGEVMNGVWNILKTITNYTEKRNQKIDTKTFFYSIKQYIEENLSEPLSLQSICSVFGISQTYLSRLFRKYANQSFNKYLTSERISRAKKYIEENPEIPLKDIAAFVGYQDPFYFSRVFKSITGIPPSEYMNDETRKSV